jgi:tetratricopeptide (TPR) repeat protein
MKTFAASLFFLAGVIFAPRALAQQPGAGKPPATAPAPNTPAGKAAAAAAQRKADEILARTYMVTKRFGEAGDVYEKLAKANPRDPSYLNLVGIAHMKDGDLRGARKWFERCIKREPRFADAYNNLGATWYTDKNFKRALQYYQRAVALQPGVAGYHTNVGFAYFSLKMPVEAEQAFRRALLMDPFVFQQNDRTGSVLQDRSVADQGLFAFTMAKSYAGTGDAAHCASYLRRALDEGYKDVAKAYTDPGFAGVLSDPEVQAVLSLIPAAGSEAAVPASR